MSEPRMLDRRVEAILNARLEQLRQVSGLPVVLAGTATWGSSGRRLRLTTLSGTVGRTLLGMEITAGHGIGGLVVSRANPYKVDDYASATAITHDYDHIIVGQERIHSMFAVPVVVDGAVRGAFYGAARDGQPIGDVALCAAGRVAASAVKDIERLPVSPEPVASDRASQPGLAGPRTERAIHDLASLIRTVGDPALRDRLAKILDDLGGPAWNGPTSQTPGGPAVTLAPRELDVIRSVEIGASNTAIAEDLGLSLHTVKAYLSSAMRKLNAPNRTTAVHTARALGLL